MCQEDIIETNSGALKISFLGHASLMFTFNKRVIYVDPVCSEADYTKLPQADLILITHEHSDHCDPEAVKILYKTSTEIILTERCTQKIKGGIIMRNGDMRTVQGLQIQAVPAYNIVHMRYQGVPFHPKGYGNGYVIAFADKRVYIAGDTENNEEIKALKNIFIAFLPMNLPYTMTAQMVADAARAIKPRILYPYHMTNSDPAELIKLMQADKNIEIRLRRMK